ncbi:hypothetical protein [Streptomyces malaysiensis]|uniref:RIFT barrel domain-containing protein n=1 Tax=Streptomyces malaysiensis TaxID=92644 RepID=UPI0032D5810C
MKRTCPRSPDATSSRPPPWPDGSLKWTAHAAAVRAPPQLATGPADLAHAEVFGGLFAPSTAPPPPRRGSRTVLISPSTAISAISSSAVGTAARPRRTPCPSASAPTGAASPRSGTWRSSATSRRGSHAVAVR